MVVTDKVRSAMEPVVPKFIDELIDFNAKDKKQDLGSTSEKTVSQEPKVEVQQEHLEIPPGQAKSANRH